MATSFRSRLLAQRALMHRLRQRQRRNPLQAGFTLIELLIVVIIIGILSSIALPAFLSQREKADNAAAASTASAVARKCAAQLATGDEDLGPTEADLALAQEGPPAITLPACAADAAYIGGDTTWTVNADGTITKSDTQ